MTQTLVAGMDSSGKFGIGSSTKHIQWDGSDLEIKVTNLTWTATNSSMTANGTLTATNADISGKITATTGLIGGWHVGSTSLWNATTEGSSTAEGDYSVAFQVNSSATAAISDSTMTMYTRKYVSGGWRYGYSLTYGGQITLNTFDSSGKNTDRVLLGHGSFEIRHATKYSSSDPKTMSEYDSMYVSNGMLRFNRAGNNVAYMGPWTWDLQNSSGTKEGFVFLGQLNYLGIGHGVVSDIVINNGLNDGFTERIILRDTTRLSGNTFLSSGVRLYMGSTSSAYFTAKSNGAIGLGLVGTSSYARYLVCDSSDNMRLYSSSSKRYKNLIGEVSEEEAKKLLSLPVVNFVYKPGYLVEDDENNGRMMAGLFAEDVANLFPDAAYHHDGQIENYADRQLLVRLIKLCQIQQREIEALKKGVS